MKHRLILFGGALILLSGLAWVYSAYNPAESAVFPKCPLYSMTGLKCPGCGSQRAVHYLLNGQFIPAFRANPLLVMSIPYLALGFLQRLPGLPADWKNRLAPFYEGKAVWIAGGVLLVYWVGRNLG